MARLIEMIKQSAVPAGVMRSAARGALSVPPEEMLEILVYLSEHAIFGEQARMTLAAFDEAGSAKALADPNTPREVLNYFLAPGNHRPRLLPALLNNPSVPEEALANLAGDANRETTELLLATPRLMRFARVLKPLLNNPNLLPEEHAKVAENLKTLGVGVAEEAGNTGDVEVISWVKEHRTELDAEEKEAKPFVLLGGVDELGDEEGAVVNIHALEAQKGKSKEEDERLSILQKLARMNVGERIKVAMLGSREERGILIRDGSKIVSSAVLASPKLSEQEVEGFSNMKNVRENVLREIARSRKFMKNYVVLRNLCNNPRTPLDLSLSLMKNLLGPDLKLLAMNKNVPETLRKMAIRLTQTRTPGGGG